MKSTQLLWHFIFPGDWSSHQCKALIYTSYMFPVMTFCSVRRSLPRWPNNLNVYEPQHNLGRGLGMHKTEVQPILFYYWPFPDCASVMLYHHCHRLSTLSLTFLFASFVLDNLVVTCWERTVPLAFNLCCFILEPHHEKTCFYHMRTTKAQIRLRRWSAPLLFTA